MDISTELQALLQQFLLFVPRLVVALAIFAATLVLSAMAARSVRRRLGARLADPNIARLLAILTRWGLVVLGTLVALEQVDFDVTSFVAGLGIAGFTVGLALQDIARNFVAGVLLLTRQPFGVGDFIETSGLQGTVLDVTVRDTVIRTLDGETVVVPNFDVYTHPIVNYSGQPQRRRTVHIGLGYGEDVRRAVGVFLAAVRGVDGVLGDPPPTIRAEELGDSALQLAARFWVDQTTDDLLQVHSDVVQAVKEAAERDGIDLPYPTQTVRLEGTPPAGSTIG